MTDTSVMTLGDVARRFDRPTWMVRRLYERGILPEPPRLGVYRVVPVAAIPQIERALIAVGYLEPADARAAA